LTHPQALHLDGLEEWIEKAVKENTQTLSALASQAAS